MHQKFTFIGDDETKIKITVSIEASRYALTKDEQKSLKESLKNSVHNMLRDYKYDVSQIKEVKS